MGQIRNIIAHQLGAAEAKSRLCSFIGSMMREYPDQVHKLEMKFSGLELAVKFSAYGFEYDWTVLVGDQDIELVGKFPDTANPYRGKIEKTVVGKIEDVLSEPIVMRRAA